MTGASGVAAGNSHAAVWMWRCSGQTLLIFRLTYRFFHLCRPYSASDLRRLFSGVKAAQSGTPSTGNSTSLAHRVRTLPLKPQ